MPDWLRLALGTLTIVRVPAPHAIDRRTAGRAMTAAPVVGVIIAIPAAVVLWLTGPRSALLASTLAIVTLALFTRALHLDGLADTADGLGSGRAGDDALAIMSRSDIGPFGVVTLLLTVLTQVAALTSLTEDGLGPAALVSAIVVSRAALPLACRVGLPAARPTGLGATVAGSVSVPAVAASVIAAESIVAATGWWAAGPRGSAVLIIASAFALVGSVLLVRRCVRRFGGITGDVLGAAVEVAAAISLAVAALIP